MHPLLIEKQDAIIQLCRQHHVRKLEVFGSIVRHDFDTQKSDIDFLVEFNKDATSHYADNYFAFLNALQSLLDTPVDLIVISSLKNPYFLESIATDRHFLYAA